MPIDPLVALAFSVQSNKGVYALLLGSGVSRSAGVPTGWEVVLDLIRKLAVVQGEAPEPTPEQWFKAKHGDNPDYATLLDALTLTAPERTQLLRSYFEQNEEERSQGLKSPMPAHRAIAELMRLGYFRVVLTTNFDRLLEQAIRDAGVEPTVISTPGAIKGAEPLTHARCTVIKLHGDYLDHRLKNTPRELAAYEKPMDRLLDRVLDEFGLIVCGWSGQNDTGTESSHRTVPQSAVPHVLNGPRYRRRCRRKIDQSSGGYEGHNPGSRRILCKPTGQRSGTRQFAGQRSYQSKGCGSPRQEVSFKS